MDAAQNAFLLGRRNVYLWLSAFFIESPSPQRLHELLGSEVLEQIGTILEPLAPQDFADLRNTVTTLSDKMAEQLKHEYERLFVVPTPTYIPPFESCFVDKFTDVRDYGELLGRPASEIRVLFGKANFEIKTDSSIPPDHIGIELNLMAALIGEEATASDINEISTVERMQALQRSLLSKHLVAWIGAFRREVEKSPVSAIYKYLARITEIFLGADNEFLRSSPKSPSGCSKRLTAYGPGALSFSSVRFFASTAS